MDLSAAKDRRRDTREATQATRHRSPAVRKALLAAAFAIGVVLIRSQVGHRRNGGWEQRDDPAASPPERSGGPTPAPGVPTQTSGLPAPASGSSSPNVAEPTDTRPVRSSAIILTLVAVLVLGGLVLLIRSQVHNGTVNARGNVAGTSATTSTVSLQNVYVDTGSVSPPTDGQVVARVQASAFANGDQSDRLMNVTVAGHRATLVDADGRRASDGLPVSPAEPLSAQAGDGRARIQVTVPAEDVPVGHVVPVVFQFDQAGELKADALVLPKADWFS